MAKFGIVLKIGLLLIITASFFGLSLGCSDEEPSPTPTTTESPTPTSTGTDITTIDPNSIAEESKANFSLAEKKASEWSNSAVLYAVSIKIPNTLNPSEVVEVYTFGSPAALQNWWTISISVRTGNYIRAVIPKEDYLGSNLIPVARKYWKINYVEALQTAEKNGGKEWRDSISGDIQINETLMHTDPNNYLYWVVDYQTLSGSDKLTVKVDANTGEVAKED